MAKQAMSFDLLFPPHDTTVLRHYKVSLLLITRQGDIQNMSQEILCAKPKPDSSIQNIDSMMNF